MDSIQNICENIATAKLPMTWRDRGVSAMNFSSRICLANDKLRNQLTIETLAWRRALFSSCSCLQRNLQVSSSIFNTLFSCFKSDIKFFSLWATDEVLSSALMSLSLNPVPSIEELKEPAMLETHHNAPQVNHPLLATPGHRLTI